MFIYETEAFVSLKPYCTENINECKTIYLSPVEKAKYSLTESDVHERYFSTSTDSDSGYSPSCNTPSSSESENWECLSGFETEDDVFTEREVVLSYDGSKIAERNVCKPSVYLGEYAMHSKQVSIESDLEQDNVEWVEQDKQMKKEPMEETVETSCSNEFYLQTKNCDDEDDVKNMNINEINCTDSFLKWLNSEQDSNRMSDFDEQCHSNIESNDSFENDEDSTDFNNEFPEVVYSPSSAFSTDYYNHNKEYQTEQILPPIQTMIPAGSKMIHSFSSDQRAQSRNPFNSLIRGSPTSLHMDGLVGHNISYELKYFFIQYCCRY